MTPVLHIIGMGHEGLDKLTLRTWKILSKAQLIFVLSKEHKTVKEMIAEGYPCLEIGESEDRGDWEAAVDYLVNKITSTLRKEYMVLALPGYPLREGRIITGLERSLGQCFQIDASSLSDPHSIERLMGIMAELRSSWGCPWDKEQNHESLRKYLVEETYEVIEAIDTKNMNNFCEELGDLLLQVVFHSRIAQEEEHFSLADVIKTISDKLVRRHPHVFGSVIAETSEAVLTNWEAIKKDEKAAQGNSRQTETEDYFRIPKGLPALLLAEKVQKKAAKIGFDWEGYQGPLAKIREELVELENEIGNSQRLEEEFGDLLFSVVNLSRPLQINAEEALRLGTIKFQKRFNDMLALIRKKGLDVENLSLSELDLYWDQVKFKENNGTLGAF